MPKLDFERDVVNEIVRFFDERSIKFEREQSSGAEWHIERYFRFRLKVIAPRPRRVRYSTELRAKLPTLADRFHQPFTVIEDRFATGGDVSEFQSRLASNVSVPDAMLNDLGLHHLHLAAKRSPVAKRVERSDMLLLVMVRPDDAYLVDIRPHPRADDPNDYGWSRQEYLQVINRNWPHLLDPCELQGVTGDSIPDSGRKELQRKNANVVTEIDGRAIAPPGGGTTSSGANATHVWLAKRLLWLVNQTQQMIETHWAECRRDLRDAGVHAEDDAEFRLVRIDDDDLTPKVQSRLTTELSRSGWIIQHVASGVHIDWDFG